MEHKELPRVLWLMHQWFVQSDELAEKFLDLYPFVMCTACLQFFCALKFDEEMNSNILVITMYVSVIHAICVPTLLIAPAVKTNFIWLSVFFHQEQFGHIGEIFNQFI